jgi:hypothetical protein
MPKLALRSKGHCYCLCALISFAACSTSPGVPETHRVLGQTCTAMRGRESVSAEMCSTTNPTVTCRQDADCTQGTNGRCLGGLHCVTSCSYDSCFSDSDCPTDKACLCRGNESSFVANVCVPAECHTDLDCGSRGFCSLSLSGCFGAEICGDGYYCHTSHDSCIDDNDCASRHACFYDLLEKRWSCKQYTLPY